MRESQAGLEGGGEDGREGCAAERSMRGREGSRGGRGRLGNTHTTWRAEQSLQLKTGCLKNRGEISAARKIVTETVQHDLFKKKSTPTPTKVGRSLSLQ